MQSKQLIGTLAVALLVLVFAATSVLATSDKPSSQGAKSENAEWVTYTDPLFDFKVSYPADWVVIPRDDSLGAGGTLTFIADDQLRGQDYHQTPIPKIEIGMYLVERPERGSLKEWTDQYNELSDVPADNEINIRKSEWIIIDGRKALYEEGYSSLTEFQYANVSRGDIVWFIWSNRNSEEFGAVFNQMADSFRFGENTPDTLQEVYGSDFRSFPLGEQQETTGENSTSTSILQAFDKVISPMLISSSWRSPLNNGPFNVRCDSASHSGSSNHAIDIPRSAGTLVVGANTGNVYFAGWDAGGYGNLVRARTGSQEAFYAHLQSIDWTSLQQTNPWRVTKHSSVGWIGSTGNSTGNHLHFHVRNVDTNASVDLSGMTTFSPTSGLYPESGNPCGTIKYP